MDCSIPGFLVLHYLLEFAQTLVHQELVVYFRNDFIQLSDSIGKETCSKVFLNLYAGLISEKKH